MTTTAYENETKICPIGTLVSGRVLDEGKCMGKECAWWDDGACVMSLLAFRLKELNESLDDIEDAIE